MTCYFADQMLSVVLDTGSREKLVKHTVLKRLGLGCGIDNFESDSESESQLVAGSAWITIEETLMTITIEVSRCRAR